MASNISNVDEFLQPEFQSPPVIETVLSAQFDPIPGLTSGHLGALWKEFGPHWPSIIEAPPLQPEFEFFGGGPNFQIMGFPLWLQPAHSSRLQIRAASGDRMLQMQNTRITFNWLKSEGGSYTRFGVLLPEFTGILGKFSDFLMSQGLSAMKLNQWEVSYVNRLEKGSLWELPEDWSSLVGGFMPTRPVHPSLSLESMGGEWHFEIKPQRGRLHMNIQHGRTGPQLEQQALFVRLTARGPISSTQLPGGSTSGASSVDEGLKLGHDVIVDSFFRLTSGNAHAVWEVQK